MSLVEVTDLNIAFGENKALKGVSFKIPEGACIGVVGESGSGKSLSALSLMGLLPHSAQVATVSKLVFEGEKLTNEKVAKIRGVEMGMIFQEPMTSLNPVLKCGQQLTEVLVKHKQLSTAEAHSKCIDLFKKVKLKNPEEAFNKYPHQLSGGQKQRVMIAIAICCEPKLLIADEPTTALDVTVQKEIIALLKQLKDEEGMSMLFITHDLSLVAEIASEVLVMRKGEIVEQGLAKEIFSNPSHPYTKALLACRPPLDKRYKLLPTISDFIGSKNQLKQGRELIEKEERAKQHNTIYGKPSILSVQDLFVAYDVKKNWRGKIVGENKVVNGVSFELFRGESLGIVGESGCGKTTIGRTIVKLQAQRKGVITYRGKNVLALNKKETKDYRKKVQIIFQDPYASLNPRLRIGEAIMEPMKVHGIGSDDKDRKARVYELMNKVGLSAEHYDRYPHEFSGGQRQRISIARTLALDPEVIICDESVSALDVSIQAQVLNLLNKLKREHQLTFIFISHDLSVVKHFCDRMLVINKRGQIEEEGECDELYASAQSLYTKNLVSAIPKGHF